MRQDRENQFWTERLERAVVKWTRSTNSHTGPRHMNGRSSRPDTCQHPTTRLVTPKQFFLHRGGRPHMSRVFRTFGLAERRPALAQAVTAPLICWSFSSSMFKYLLVDHAVPATWRTGAAARLRHDWPSGNAPTTRVRRRISFTIRSSGLLVHAIHTGRTSARGNFAGSRSVSFVVFDRRNTDSAVILK